jgi:hypothetical protein
MTALKCKFRVFRYIERLLALIRRSHEITLGADAVSGVQLRVLQTRRTVVLCRSPACHARLMAPVTHACIRRMPGQTETGLAAKAIELTGTCAIPARITTVVNAVRCIGFRSISGLALAISNLWSDFV